MYAVADPSRASGELQFRVSRPTPDTAVLHVEGEIDMLTASTLDTAVTDELDAAPANLVLDFAAVSFLASSGLAVLVRAASVAAERHIRLVLVGTNRAVLRPLQVTGLTELFTIHPSLDVALTDHLPRLSGET